MNNLLDVVKHKVCSLEFVLSQAQSTNQLACCLTFSSQQHLLQKVFIHSRRALLYCIFAFYILPVLHNHTVHSYTTNLHYTKPFCFTDNTNRHFVMYYYSRVKTTFYHFQTYLPHDFRYKNKQETFYLSIHFTISL